MWKSLLFVFLGIAICGYTVKAASVISIFSTTQQAPDFTSTKSSFGAAKDSSAIEFTINSKAKHQTILGFGGTFSDATGLTLKKASPDVRKQVLEALFGNEGIGLSLCRVPIGGTEFSTRLYTLDDHTGDTSLSKFALQTEDTEAKIPIIKEAQALRKDLKLFASAWTAPLWMKDHKIWVGYSMLSETYGKVYAEYLKKFLDEYKKLGVNWWGISTGTNPSSGFKKKDLNSMGWVPDLQAKWIKEHFGPLLRNSSYKSIKILGHDDTPLTFPYFAPVYVEDEETLKYLDGLATHWYMNTGIHPSVTDFAKNPKKELFLLATETSYGNVNPVVGNWDKAYKILDQIVWRLFWNSVGWVDSNLVLDSTGGPSYAGIHSDAPIILSSDGKSFTKTPAYYVLGHFSKYVIPGSVRIDVTFVPYKPSIETLAFVRPDKVKVVVLYNSNPGNVAVQLVDNGNYSHVITLPGKSIHTLLY